MLFDGHPGPHHVGDALWWWGGWAAPGIRAIEDMEPADNDDERRRPTGSSEPPLPEGRGRIALPARLVAAQTLNETRNQFNLEEKMTDRIETVIADAANELLGFPAGDLASSILAALKAAPGIAVVELPEPEYVPDDLVLETIQEGLEAVGAVISVADDGDDSGTPGILTPGGAVCMYDLNNEICAAFQGYVRDNPSQAHEFALVLLSAAGEALNEMQNR